MFFFLLKIVFSASTHIYQLLIAITCNITDNFTFLFFKKNVIKPSVQVYLGLRKAQIQSADPF